MAHPRAASWWLKGPWAKGAHHEAGVNKRPEKRRRTRSRRRRRRTRITKSIFETPVSQLGAFSGPVDFRKH